MRTEMRKLPEMKFHKGNKTSVDGLIHTVTASKVKPGNFKIRLRKTLENSRG